MRLALGFIPWADKKKEPAEPSVALLERARKSCRVLTADRATENLQTVRARLVHTQREDAVVSEFEGGARQEIGANFDDLLAEEDALERIVRGEMTYPIFDISVLGWRNKKDGFPSFAIFRLDEEPLCLIKRATSTRKVHGSTEWTYFAKLWAPQGLPQRIYSAYIGDALALDERFQEAGIGGVEMRYTGVIPIETRQKIEEARKHFGTDIFIVAEAKWKEIPDPDPLVIGWDGANAWLIDAFELTPLEQYVRSEFTA